MNGYRLIVRAEVPSWLRETVDDAVIDACRELGLQPQAVRWYTGSGNLAAWVDADRPGEVHFVLDRMRTTTVYAARARVFHEIRHAFQLVKKPWLDRKQAEEDANRFCRQCVGVDPELMEFWEIGL